jgi:hypothetical protein
LHLSLNDMHGNLNDAHVDNQDLQKKLKEKEKIILYLEKEIGRRSAEYAALVFASLLFD